MKKIFTEDIKKLGMHWFMPHVGEWVEGVPCVGVGEEKYEEGSLYIGEMEYDGKEFYKQGHGVQTFEDSTFWDFGFGGKLDTYTVAFVGNFDKRKSGWMYGNGILYFADKDMKPHSFIKGFFNSIKVVKEWEGEFSEDMLFPGYTLDMEITQDVYGARFERLERNNCRSNFKHYDYVFFGDSWMDMWNEYSKQFGAKGFSEDVKGLSAIDVGVGGTEYKDWTNERLDNVVLGLTPKKVVIHLGVNDVNHLNELEDIKNSATRVVNYLHEKSKDLQIYLCSTTHVLSHIQNWNKYDEMNAFIKKLANEREYVHYLSTCELFLDESGNGIPNFDTYLIPDKLHLNGKGYEVWGSYILKEITK